LLLFAVASTAASALPDARGSDGASKARSDNAAVSKAQKAADLLQRAGNSYVKCHWNDCVTDANKAISMLPALSSGYYFSGMANWQMERYEQAIPMLTEYIQLVKDHVDSNTYVVRGECYWALGDSKKAIADWTKGLAYAPKSEVALTRRSEAYCELHQFDKAIKDATAFVTYYPRLARSYSFRGRILMAAGKNAESIADFTKAISIEPDLPEPYGCRSQAYEKMGKFALAAIDRQRCNVAAKRQTTVGSGKQSWMLQDSNLTH